MFKVSLMNANNSTDRMGRIIGWGAFGLVILIGISVISYLLFNPSVTRGNSQFTFFPFHFGFIGIIFGIFIIFLISRWIFWPDRCGYPSRYPSKYNDNDNLQNIIKERYARGEITREQYEKIKKDIKQND